VPRATIAVALLVAGCFDGLDEKKLTGRDAAAAQDLASGGGSLCPGSFLLCDGFESGLIDGTLWSTIDDGGHIGVDTMSAYRGQYGAHFQSLATDGGTEREELVAKAGVASLNDIYVRFFVQLPPTLPAVDVRLANVEATTAPYIGDGIYVARDGHLALHAQVNNDMTESTAPVPLGGWLCIEWHVKKAAQGMQEAWVNDQPAFAAPVMDDTLPSNGLGVLKIGPALFGNLGDPALDYAFDEVVLDSARVTCAR
jgi:hypothetical protein